MHANVAMMSEEKTTEKLKVEADEAEAGNLERDLFPRRLCKYCIIALLSILGAEEVGILL